MADLKIVFVNPNAFGDSSTFLLPYNELIARACLKKYVEAGQISFLPGQFLNPLTWVDADIYIFSAYVWNWERIKDYATEVKVRSPKSLCLVGGPQIPKDSKFLNQHTQFDLASTGEMELVLPLVIQSLIEQGHIDGVPGTYTQDSMTPLTAPKWNWDDGLSPYIYNRDYIRELTSSRRDMSFIAFWESIRGCPYKCQFCDWGGYTNSKLRAKSMDLIKSEMDFFSEMGIDQVTCIDANFGIAQRDQQIVEWVGELKTKNSYPKTFIWAPTKSSLRSVKRITEIIDRYDLGQKVPRIDLQTTDPSILSNIQRENIPYEKLRSMIVELSKTKNIGTGLIMGLPGETLASFKKTIYDCIDLGIHEDFEIFSFSLLPNAPASAPEFIERFDLRWIERLMHSESIADPTELNLSYEKIVISSYSYSTEDWVSFYLWKCFIESFHKLGLARALVANQENYQALYQELYDKVFCQEYAPLHEAIHRNLHAFISGDKLHNKIFKKQIGYLDPEDWLFSELIDNYDQFLERVSKYIPVDEARLEFQRKAFLRPQNSRLEKFQGLNPLTGETYLNEIHFSHPETSRKDHLLIAKKRFYKAGFSNLYLNPSE